MEPIRFGIVGARHPHIELLIDELARRRGEVDLVAVAEDDPSLREQLSQRLGVESYADYREMLVRERLDAVGVVTVNNERGNVIETCLREGVHVVADKPLCTRLDGLRAIERAWRDSGRLLSVLFDKRFYPPTLAVRDLIAAGELGEIVLAWASGPHRLRRATRPAWMFRRDAYGGILNDLAVHDVDLLLWLTGSRSGWVQGLTGNAAHRDLPEFEDHGQVLLRSDEGLMAAIEVHWLSPEAAPHHGDYRMVLTGTNGSAELRWAQNTLTVATHQTPPRQVDLGPQRPGASDFFSALILGEEQVIHGEEVLVATRVALLAQSAANDGTWQRWAVD